MASDLTTSSPPPSYQQNESPRDRFYSIEEKWDVEFEKEAGKPHVKCNLLFEYCPPPQYKEAGYLQRLFQPNKSQPGWRAFVWILSRNLPRLMKSGFRWSSANIPPGSTAITNGERTSSHFHPKVLSSCYKHRRWYRLEENGINAK